VTVPVSILVFLFATSVACGPLGLCSSPEQRKATTRLLFVSLGLFAVGILSAFGADFGFHAVGPFLPVSDVDAFATHQYRFWYGFALVALIASMCRRELPATAGATVGGWMVLIWLLCEALWAGRWI